MKRNDFITAVLAVSATPLVFGFSSLDKDVRQARGFMVSAGEGRYHDHIKLKGVN